LIWITIDLKKSMKILVDEEDHVGVMAVVDITEEAIVVFQVIGVVHEIEKETAGKLQLT
jgi:hypothetical protein